MNKEAFPFLLLVFMLLLSNTGLAQNEDDDEDWDAYGEVEYLGGESKSFANAKIVGLSPQRFVTIGYEYQMPYRLRFSQIDAFNPDNDRKEDIDKNLGEEARADYTGGLRFNANIPIISKNNILWQLGANYMQTAYRFNDVQRPNIAIAPNLIGALESNALQTAGLFTTVYKPLNEKSFLLFQVQADMSGNYTFSNLDEQYLRYSAAALWGKRPNDRKQWAVGLSRTYRVGNMNYIPVLMFNYTSSNRKWGTEILFPARAHGRYTINNNQLLLFGYELEGNSYRISQLSTPAQSFELRRGELKPRVEYQRKLIGYFWLSLQAGVRIDYSYDADFVPDGRDFFRGFFGTQNFAMRNSLGTAPYFNVSISFVSP